MWDIFIKKSFGGEGGVTIYASWGFGCRQSKFVLFVGGGGQKKLISLKSRIQTL